MKHLVITVCLTLATLSVFAGDSKPPTLDALVQEGLARTHAKGLAIATIENGNVTQVKTWGLRNARGEPLTSDTVMYGASLTLSLIHI
jgi:CubicO group peptidase (beta-lactamase class C family)